MRIERATPDDAAELIALQHLAYASEDALYPELTIRPMLETAEEARQLMEQQLFLKVVDGGRIVGSGRAYEQGGTCHIGRLAVHPERQGQGIGTRLIAALEQHFPEVERYELFTGDRSLPNLRLYERLGYRRVREQQIAPGMALVFLEKQNPRR